MKRLVFILSFIVLLIGGFYFIRIEKGSITSLINQTQEEAIAIPLRLEIPAINVNAPIESVGQDSEGRMDVPSIWFATGWYNLGYRPGHKGSAVISGHYDRADGGKAVFYNLDNLSIGDEIHVYDKDEKKRTFYVTAKESYPWNQVPLEEIFNTTGKATLNLITCEGVWDSRTRNYQERLVIYSEAR